MHLATVYAARPMFSFRGPAAPSSRSGRWLRSGAIGLIGVAGAVVLLRFLNDISPVKHWLIWDLLAIWGWQLLLAAAMSSFGHRLVTTVFRVTPESGVETISLSAALGAVGFVMGMYIGGFLGLYGRVFAVAWPLLMLAAGAPTAAPAARDAFRAWRQAPAPPPSLITGAARVFGVLCLGLLYLGVMSPDAVNYDAAWMHLAIAQDYAREGRIVPFPGDWVKNVPHLGSVVNTWSFLVPGFREPALRWMMGLHTEFVFLLWTLVHITALVRWFLRDGAARAAWVALFLFPAIFVHDSNLGGAADHFLAFFAAPLFLAGMRAASSPSPRVWAMAGALAGAAVLTKFQAINVLVPLAVLMMGGAVVVAVRDRGQDSVPRTLGRLFAGPAVALACAVVVTLPHFLKNWVYYRNPFYPLLQGVFTMSTPSVPDAVFQMDYLFADYRWHPPKELAARLRSAAKIAFTFSFKPHSSFIALPIFGSLLTLSLPLVLFVRDGRRLWAGIFVSLAALFLWAFTYLIDRNLQTVLPIFAATTAALLARAWQTGWLARLGVSTLVVAQIAWGAPLMFHGRDRIYGAVNVIRSNFEPGGGTRYQYYRREYINLGQALPKDALVLLHDHHLSLGIDRRIILDWIGFQGLIDYRPFGTARDLWHRLKALGVTHIVSTPGARPAASKQEEVVFAALSALHGGPKQHFGGLELMALPTQPPPQEAPYQVLALGIGGYADGVYQVTDLGTCQELPAELQRFAGPRSAATPDSADKALPGVQVLLLGSGVSLSPSTSEALMRDFRMAAGYQGFIVYLRTTGPATP
jgi:hypothetical protein